MARAAEKAPKNRQKTILALEGEFHTVLKSKDTSREKLYRAGESLVMTYLESSKVQEAIWTLQFMDEWRMANVLEERFEEFLRTAPIQRSKILGGGVTQTYLETLGPGVSVVFKKGELFTNLDQVNPLREVLAYRLSKLLGLKSVPTTVLPKNVKTRTGSRMAYIKNSSQSNVNFRGNPSEYWRSQELYTLDFITNNIDRHWQNSLYRAGQHFVAIDHERVPLASPLHNALNGRIVPEALPRGRLLKRLKRVTKEVLKAELQDLAPDAKIDFIYNQLQVLIRAANQQDNATEDLLPARLRPSQDRKISARQATTLFAEYANSLKGISKSEAALRLSEWIEWNEVIASRPSEYKSALSKAFLKFSPRVSKPSSTKNSPPKRGAAR